jgi:hypothetical protein
MKQPIAAFHTTALRLPVPGSLGPDVATYLGLLEMQGLSPSTRY